MSGLSATIEIQYGALHPLNLDHALSCPSSKHFVAVQEGDAIGRLHRLHERSARDDSASLSITNATYVFSSSRYIDSVAVVHAQTALQFLVELANKSCSPSPITHLLIRAALCGESPPTWRCVHEPSSACSSPTPAHRCGARDDLGRQQQGRLH